MATNKPRGKILKCSSCGHSWRYKGSLGIATCASCGGKVRTEIVNKTLVEKLDKKGKFHIGNKKLEANE